MGRRGAIVRDKVATPTLEQFKGIKHSTVVVGASVLQVPSTNLSHRKGLIVQNKHASNTVYLGGGLPYLIEGSTGEVFTDPAHDQRNLKWILSAGGTNEWYLATSAGGDPGLTEVTYLYYAAAGGTPGSETLATAGTVGSLAAQHRWDWGDGDTLGWNTVYIRTDGSGAANNPALKYDLILGYYFTLTADDATTGGIELGPLDSIHLTLDGSARVFAIASAASTAVGVLEVI